MLPEMMMFLRTAGALAAVLGAMLILAWVTRRLGLPGRLGGSDAGRLRVLETRWLDPRTRLVLLRYGEVEHLLLISPAGAHLLDRSLTAGSRPGPAQGGL